MAHIHIAATPGVTIDGFRAVAAKHNPPQDIDGLLAWAQRTGQLSSRTGYVFGHGAEYTLPDGLMVITSYHPSLQNTNTGKLTRPMFLSIFRRARELAGRRVKSNQSRGKP